MRMKKAGPRRSPLLKRLRSVYLPNELTRQQTTGHKQRTRAKRNQRCTTRRGKRTTSSSRRRAAATATTSGRGRGRGRSAFTTATTTGSSARSGVDVHVLASGDAANARQHLILANAKLLRDASEILLVVGVVLAGRSGLDLVTVHVLDATTDGSRLGESRGGGGQDHGHNRGQQHYLPQTDSPFSTLSHSLKTSHAPLYALPPIRRPDLCLPDLRARAYTILTFLHTISRTLRPVYRERDERERRSVHCMR